MRKVRRALIVGLAFVAVLLLLASVALRVPAVVGWLRDLPLGPLAAATPPPPAIAAPAGPLPERATGMQEFAQDAGADWRVVGSGFLLWLRPGTLIGVTTAHSLAALGRATAGASLQAVGLGGSELVVRVDTLYGEPGQAFSGDDLSMDYVLLKLPAFPDAEYAFEPDSRGAAQPGERVGLFCARCSAPFVRWGTVLTSTPSAAWVLMDDTFDPNGMSGSPVLSGYTGQVIGMAVAASRQHGRLLIGLNPIGSIVAHGLAAHDFPVIAGYVR